MSLSPRLSPYWSGFDGTVAAQRRTTGRAGRRGTTLLHRFRPRTELPFRSVHRRIGVLRRAFGLRSVRNGHDSDEHPREEVLRPLGPGTDVRVGPRMRTGGDSKSCRPMPRASSAVTPRCPPWAMSSSTGCSPKADAPSTPPKRSMRSRPTFEENEVTDLITPKWKRPRTRSAGLLSKCFTGIRFVPDQRP